MDNETKRMLRERIKEDILEIGRRLDRNLRLLDDTRWGTAEKHALQVRRCLLEAEAEVGNLLYELRDCIRDDERRE